MKRNVTKVTRADYDDDDPSPGMHGTAPENLQANQIFGVPMLFVLFSWLFIIKVNSGIWIGNSRSSDIEINRKDNANSPWYL